MLRKEKKRCPTPTIDKENHTISTNDNTNFPGYDMETALIALVDDLLQELLDISAAFNTTDSGILLGHLPGMGFETIVLLGQASPEGGARGLLFDSMAIGL